MVGSFKIFTCNGKTRTDTKLEFIHVGIGGRGKGYNLFKFPELWGDMVFNYFIWTNVGCSKIFM